MQIDPPNPRLFSVDEVGLGQEILPLKATPSLVSLGKNSACTRHTGKLKTDIEPETDAF